MPTLAEFLQQLFAGLSVNEAAEQTGIDPSVMSRLLRGRGKPSVENMLRIAFATGTHPALLFEISGRSQLAFLCRGIEWQEGKRTLREADLYSARQARIHRRLQRMLELGFSRQAEAALVQLEAAWEMLRPAFEAFAEESGATAAVLTADSPARQGDVLFTWNCSEPSALELAEKGDLAGWRSYRHLSGPLTLTLFLKGPQTSSKQTEMVLALWAVQLRKLYE